MKPRLLANENFPAQSVAYLREHGYDVFSVAEAAASLSDREVLALALAEGRWILTFDRDYGELVFAKGLPTPPAVIYLRLASYRPEEPGHLLSAIFDRQPDLAGCFVVVEVDGLRKRPLPTGRSA